ncbi:cytochrome P450 4V2-like [Argiope bruennichi]|uniref:Cytochrome P450 4V2 like protein n=1 Tax=Argiope bruennichi TaxID=94029 RepID=A0A8T0EZX3_ARGBR|nr:cytochrome P450 4V2-like [Argiope bruennichi]KAF8783291.1 Cytochrome P450 4V2 like protein [Argiope bruennichi]
MATSTFLTRLTELRNNVDTWQVLSTLCIVVFTGIVLVVLKYALFRRKYNRLWPSTRLGFIDVLGHLGEFPWTEQAKNGFSFNVFLLQITSGFNRMFHDKQLYCFWVSYVPFIIITKAEATEALISGTKHMEKGWTYMWLHPWLGTGLLTSHGSKWKSRRKLLTPSFHFDILKDFMPIFNEQAHVFAKRMQKEITKDFTDIVMPVTLCSLDIICETTLGVTIDAQGNSDSQYVKSVTRAGEIIMERMVNSYYWIDFFFNFTEAGKELNQHLKILHNFTMTVIQEKKRKLLSGDPDIGTKKKRMALMDLLLEHHIKTKSLTEEDIREEVDTFAFEGHDTTSMGISWALYLIGLHKDVQEKVHEELDSIFGDDTERHATTEDIKDMKYLDCVLKESQRIYPSVPIIARQINEDTNICGYPIPKGTSCLVYIYNLHRDERWFPDPEKFDPDRFLPENSANRHPFAYIPFSAGPRNCIGQRFAQMEEKIIVSTILRSYTLQSLDQRDKLPPAPELILRSSLPIRIKVRPRKKLLTHQN